MMTGLIGGAEYILYVFRIRLAIIKSKELHEREREVRKAARGDSGCTGKSSNIKQDELCCNL